MKALSLKMDQTVISLSKIKQTAHFEQENPMVLPRLV